MNNVCKILRNSYVICSRNFLRTFRKSLLFHKNIQPSPGSEVINTDDEQTYEILSKDMQVYKDFITIEEEEGLLKEVENHLKRLRYEYDHWDDVRSYLQLIYLFSLIIYLKKIENKTV